jgi:katanin p60 ATPase-containing subunit A1
MRPRVALVYLVSPGNPTGVTLPRATLDEVAALTGAVGAWFILDSTYEAFSGEPAPPATPAAPLPAGPHVLHVGSFSKAYGAAGWRVGFIAFAEDGSGSLFSALLKINDTIPVHAAVASQALAVACLEAEGAGRAWSRRAVAGLASSRTAARAALQPLVNAGGSVAGGDAIYWWVTLPPGCCGRDFDDDAAVARWLVAKHGVAVVPGSACGCPGHLRVAFGKPAPGPAFQAAADRLRAGCEELARCPGVVSAWAAAGGAG